jgi:hypothetical protein
MHHADGGLKAAAEAFRSAMKGKHGKVIEEALQILRKRFVGDEVTDGYRKDGPVTVARFEIDGDGEEAREARLLRQRNVSDLMARLLEAIGQ